MPEEVDAPHKSEKYRQMHRKFSLLSLKTNIKDKRTGHIKVSAQPSGEGYAKAHRVSGGDRIEIFAIKKSDTGQSRFWLNMTPAEAKEYGQQLITEADKAMENND